MNSKLNYVANFSWNYYPEYTHVKEGREICQFVRAAVTNHCSLGGVHNRDLVAHSSEGETFRIKASARLVSSEVSPLSLQVAALNLRPHTVFPSV